MSIKPFSMHEAGSIGGVPGPNSGLWPGGVTVWVNTDTMEVDHVDLIGGGSLVPESEEQTPTDPALPVMEQPALDPVASNEIPQEEFPQVTPVENLEEQNVQ